MMQDEDVPEILKRLESAKIEDIDIQDYRELMQRFHDWSQQTSPYADRAKVILRKVADRFSPEELRIK